VNNLLISKLLPTNSAREQDLIAEIKSTNSKINNLSQDSAMKLLELRLLSSSTNVNQGIPSKEKWLQAALYHQDRLDKEILSLSEVKTLNSILLTGNIEEANYRQDAIFAGVSTFPASEDLRELMNKFSISLEGIEDSISKAAFSYQAICSIHPFGDANGRIARLVSDHTLIYNGYAPLIFANPKLSFVIANTDTKLNHELALTRVLESTKWVKDILRG
jgi:Fic family protein